MGRVSLWFMGAAAVALGLYYAAVDAGVSSSSSRVFFILSLAFFSIFIITGLVWLWGRIYIRFNPLEILDDIECTYWTVENHFKVRWHICDRSVKFIFQAGYSARFKDGQIVNKAGDLKSGFYRAIDKDCLNGRKFWLEIYIKDIMVNEPDECEITLTTKPYGRFWRSKQKAKEVKVLVVKHG